MLSISSPYHDCKPHILLWNHFPLKKKKATCQVFSCVWRCCFPYKCWRSIPSISMGSNFSEFVGSHHHHPSGSNHVAKFDDVPAKLWLVGGFWGSNPFGKICQKASSDWIISPQSMKKSLKAEPRRTFITCLLRNSPTGPTFFCPWFFEETNFSQENTGLNYNPAFQKRKKKGDDDRLKWFLSNYDISGHHQEDQLVVNLNTLKPTSPKMHLEFWNPGLWNTSKRFKSSSVFRAICRCSKYWTGGENFFGILSRYLTKQWDLDLKPKKAPKLENGNFILDASTGPASWGRNSS